MSVSTTLAELPVGFSAKVTGFTADGPALLRLREMGLLPGTTLTLVRTAPLGDPLEIKVRGYHLSLRRNEASFVRVESLKA